MSRLCPRRSAAQQLCDAGRVLLNGRPAKSAHAVNPNDLITIHQYEAEIVARILRVPATRNVSRRDAPKLVEVLSERVFERGFG